MNQLQKFQKRNCLDPDGILGPNTLAKMKAVFEIDTDCQLAHFAGQIVHETGNFRYEEENLNYSAEALLRVFRKYFPTWESAAAVARNPEAIANIVYGERMGNDRQGDGWKYRGRGAIQLTGKNNYELFSEAMEDPDILSDPDIVLENYFFDTALFYFNENNLWKLCDEVDHESIVAVTRRINGGRNGLADRIEHTNNFYKMLT